VAQNRPALTNNGFPVYPQAQYPQNPHNYGYNSYNNQRAPHLNFNRFPTEGSHYPGYTPPTPSHAGPQNVHNGFYFPGQFNHNSYNNRRPQSKPVVNSVPTTQALKPQQTEVNSKTLSDLALETGTKFLREIKPSDSVVISPSEIFHGLSMLYKGANGQTANQLYKHIFGNQSSVAVEQFSNNNRKDLKRLGHVFKYFDAVVKQQKISFEAMFWIFLDLLNTSTKFSVFSRFWTVIYSRNATMLCWLIQYTSTRSSPTWPTSVSRMRSTVVPFLEAHWSWQTSFISKYVALFITDISEIKNRWS